MFKKKQYYYLIFYSFDDGVGNSELIFNFKIKTFSDIEMVADHICKKNGFSNVCINNFIRMKGE